MISGTGNDPLMGGLSNAKLRGHSLAFEPPSVVCYVLTTLRTIYEPFSEQRGDDLSRAKRLMYHLLLPQRMVTLSSVVM